MSLSDKIHTILKARENIKHKIKQTQLEQQITQDEISKIAPTLQEPLIREMQQQQNALLSRYGDIPPNFYPSVPAIEGAPKTKKRKVYELDPDKDIDSNLLTTLHLYFPSEFLKLYDEPQRSTAIQSTINKVNSVLQSMGGKKKKQGEGGEISRIIDNLRHYKDSIRALQHIPRFEVAGQSGAGGGGDANCKRLQLLIASRNAGNDSPLVVAEAKQILSQLLKENKITKTDYNKICSNNGFNHVRF